MTFLFYIQTMFMKLIPILHLHAWTCSTSTFESWCDFEIKYLTQWETYAQIQERHLVIFCRYFRSVLTIFKTEGSKKPPSLSRITSPNVRICFQTSWLLILKFIRHCCKISTLYLILAQSCWPWIKTTPQSFITWTYNNFSQRHAKVTKLWSHNICNIIWVMWYNFVY